RPAPGPRPAPPPGGAAPAAPPVHLAPVGQQPSHQPTAHEPVGAGHEHLHDNRSRSASTIMRTSSAKLVRGAHSSSRCALLGSACSVSTSAGRTKRGSTVTYFS